MIYMYNTIEVIVLKIRNAEIRYLKKDGFSSFEYKNIKHVKVLPYLSIVQSLEGSYDFALGGGILESTGEGGFFIAPSGLQQTIVHNPSKNGRMTCRWLFIDVEINKTHKLDELFSFPTILCDEAKAEMSALFDSLFSSDVFWDEQSICYKIIGLLMKYSSEIPPKTGQGIYRAADFITANFSRQTSISELAKIANTSESNFYAAFKKAFGSSPISYLNHYRLSIAARRLLETEDSISEIGYFVGIGDPLYFCKLFKKAYGMPPSEYRKKSSY